MSLKHGQGRLQVLGIPHELQRALHMICAQRSCSLREYITLTLYAALRRDLAGQDWQYQLKGGDVVQWLREHPNP